MLYIVSTPIGNLDDVTLRALNVLKSVDYIACEDTRHTKILLAKYDILPKKSEALNSKSATNPNIPNSKNETTGPTLVSYHQHSGESKIAQIIDLLEKGKDLALVTDAGTPGISDPGSLLIKKAIEKGIEITSVPGPSAFVSALSISGFDTREFVFIGFLPHKKGRQTKLKEIAGEKRTVVMYESVHRIKKLLKELDEIMPERNICVTRELTKKFEEIYRGKPGEIVDIIKEKGEFAVVIEGKND